MIFDLICGRLGSSEKETGLEEYQAGVTHATAGGGSCPEEIYDQNFITIWSQGEMIYGGSVCSLKPYDEPSGGRIAHATCLCTLSVQGVNGDVVRNLTLLIKVKEVWSGRGTEGRLSAAWAYLTTALATISYTMHNSPEGAGWINTSRVRSVPFISTFNRENKNRGNTYFLKFLCKLKLENKWHSWKERFFPSGSIIPASNMIFFTKF